MKRLLPVVVLALLAGCGKREALRPPQGVSLPPRPAFAATVPTPDQLLAPTTEARPERQEELLRRSEQRRDDRFDLPPPG